MTPRQLNDNKPVHDKTDALEAAHLEYLRGDHAAARAILDMLLAAEPDNEDARQLRGLAESDSVAACADNLRNETWLYRLQPSVVEFVGILLSGVGLLALGIYLALGPIYTIANHGLTAQVKYAVSRVTTSTAPAHFFLMFPLLQLSVGAFLTLACVRHLRDLRTTR